MASKDDAIFGPQPKYPGGDPRDHFAPKPGSYSGGSVEQAANRVEATPPSKAPGRSADNNQVTSSRPGPRGPFTSATSSWPEWLDPAKPLRADRNTRPDTSGSFFR